MQVGTSSIQYLSKRPEVHLRTRPHKWVEFVVGSRLAPTVSICVLRFFSPSMKANFQLQSRIRETQVFQS